MKKSRGQGRISCCLTVRSKEKGERMCNCRLIGRMECEIICRL